MRAHAHINHHERTALMSDTFGTITRDDLRDRLLRREPTVLVEALGPTSFEDAHLPGARNLPHDQVDALAADVVGDQEAFVVVYCANTPCPNSAQASRRLTQLGYRNVHEYVEGKEDWAAAGLPLERGPAAVAA
jgi:rhodanese-related sulfurtransferase